MRIEITKGANEDRIAILRDDGSRAITTFPKKGWFPHDAVHLIVEKHLEFDNGFWGHIAAGNEPDDISAMAKEGGHPSASRAGKPCNAIVELIQAERLVECFEAELWGQPSSFETFTSVLRAACEHSQIPPPNLTENDMQAMRDQLAELGGKWRDLPIGQKLDLCWP
jgi:hypothetical protein